MAISAVRLTDSMLTGPNGAAIIAVLNAHCPPKVKVVRLELIRHAQHMTVDLVVVYTVEGKDGTHSFKVPATNPGSVVNGSPYAAKLEAWLPHELILAKLALVG